MSVQRTTGMVLATLFIAVLIIPSVAVADEINEPDDWGDPVFNYSGDRYNPGDLEAAFINYNEVDETVQFRINFTDSAPDNPMLNNVTQIYIDSDTDSESGVNDETFTGGGDIETFYNNTDDIGADYRVEIGDGSNVIAPWNDGLNGFESSSAESIETETSADSVIAEFDYSTIEEEPVDTFDLKFVYIDTSGQVEDKSDYTWAPDASDNEINSTRFSITEGGDGGTVPVATIKANVNLSSNDNLDDDAAIEFTLEGSGTTETKTVEGADHTGSDDVNVTFNINANEFNDNEESITAELTGGENYTLDEEKQINTDLSDDDQVTKKFETIDLIDITGGVDGLDKESQNIEIILKDDSADPDTVDTQTIVPDESSKPYEFTDVKATQFTGGGSVEAKLDTASSNTVSPDEQTIKTDRYNAADKTDSNFTVESPPHVVDLELNKSDADVRTDNAFNVTVNLTSNSNGKDIEGITHVVEFDPAPVDVKAITPLVSAQVNTTVEAAGEVTVQLTSSSELVAQDSQDDLYNITFELEDDDAVFDPDYNTDQVVSVGTTEETRVINNSSDMKYDIDEGSDGAILSLNNTETEIEDIEDITYTHLTDTGDMVGAPTKFEVEVISTNQGKLDNVTLKNNNTGETDVYDCEGSSNCDASLQDVPVMSTYNGTGISYGIISDRYNITIYPKNNGEKTVINNPRGVGGKIYNESDVSSLGTNGLGNVTVKDVSAVLQNTGAEAGGLPWDDPVDARYDVNNDGVVDIVDATAVAQDW